MVGTTLSIEQTKEAVENLCDDCVAPGCEVYKSFRKGKEGEDYERIIADFGEHGLVCSCRVT